MKNYIYAVLFCIVVFITWLSIIFSIFDKLIGRDTLFKNNIRAIITYIVGVFLSILFSLFSILTYLLFHITIFSL